MYKGMGVRFTKLWYSDRYFDTDWQLRCLKEAKPIDMILDKC